MIIIITKNNGLIIQTEVDTNEYAKGIKITDEEMESLALEREVFHGEWNYKLRPRKIAHVIL